MHTQDGGIRINSTIQTNDLEDFDALKNYLASTEFETILESDIDDLVGITTIDVESTIIQSGETNEDEDDDDKTWFEQWFDPLNYSVFQWVVISLKLFFV
eukprot:UN06268